MYPASCMSITNTKCMLVVCRCYDQSINTRKLWNTLLVVYTCLQIYLHVFSVASTSLLFLYRDMTMQRNCYMYRYAGEDQKAKTLNQQSRPSGLHSCCEAMHVETVQTAVFSEASSPTTHMQQGKHSNAGHACDTYATNKAFTTGPVNRTF